MGQRVLPVELGICLGARHERSCSLALQQPGKDLTEERSGWACFRDGALLVQLGSQWQMENGWECLDSNAAGLPWHSPCMARLELASCNS